MANETTSTTRTELYSVQVEDLLLAATSVGNLEQLAMYIPVEDNHKTFRVPIQALNVAAAVNEAATVSNTANDTGSGDSATIAHVAIRFAQTYLDYHATGVQGLAENGVAACFRKREGDLFDFSSSTPTVGTTGTGISLAVAHSSIMELEQGGYLNPNKAFVLSPEGKQHLQYRISASTGSFYTNVGPRFLSGQAAQHVGMFLDMYPVFISSYLTAVNVSDIASGCFAYSDPRYNRGLCWRAIGERQSIDPMPTFYESSTNTYVTQINMLYGILTVDSTAACRILHTSTAVST